MSSDIQQCIDTLRKGGIILYPTDTVWGIGCDANNTDAIEKVFNLKGRSSAKALIVLVGTEIMLERSVKDMPEMAWNLIEVAEHPLTIIYDQVNNIANTAKAEDGSCGIRLPKDSFCQKLVKRYGKPIISTSANISNEPTPSDFSTIDERILNGVDFVVNYRQNDSVSQQASNVIKLKNNGEIKIIR